jgi:hypothetical protein
MYSSTDTQPRCWKAKSGQSHARPPYLRERDPVPIVQDAGWVKNGSQK